MRILDFLESKNLLHEFLKEKESGKSANDFVNEKGLGLELSEARRIEHLSKMKERYWIDPERRKELIERVKNRYRDEKVKESIIDYQRRYRKKPNAKKYKKAYNRNYYLNVTKKKREEERNKQTDEPHGRYS